LAIKPITMTGTQPMNAEQFVLAHAPQPPARLLEVGCGAGELARTLARRGYSVTAIDPDAPTGDIFRKTSLEEFHEQQPFDVVIASRSLHHIADLVQAVSKLRSLLESDGLLILNEFAWDQMDERTARWYLSQVGQPRPEDESLLPGKFPEAWIAEHEGLHESHAMRRALADVFDEQEFDWVPYIADHYLKQPDLIEQEWELIRSGLINPLGFHYVGRDGGGSGSLP
jgi:SAM-dependent methyltransferase